MTQQLSLLSKPLSLDELLAQPQLYFSALAGVDEAGRGPLAGSVFAAAVILGNNTIAGVSDSKALNERQRKQLAAEIQQKALAYSIASASVAEIDKLNILHATMLAMRRAIEGLTQQPDGIFIDGNRLPDGLSKPAYAIVGGDAKVAEISAASILAKTARDADCLRLHEAYPQYGFDRHKGYPTAAHLQVLKQLGPCPAHRHSFKPVRQAVATQKHS